MQVYYTRIRNMKLGVVFLFFAVVVNMRVQEVFGADILALLTLTTHSHHIWNRALMIALANRGHKVTVISPDIDKEPVPNLTYIHLEGAYEFIRSQTSYEDVNDERIVSKMRMLNKWASTLCEYLLSTDGAKQLLNYPDGRIFDLIIAESEYTQCFWPFITKFGNPPVVGVNGAGIPRRANYMTGTPKNPALITDYILPFSGKMDFFQRLQSFIGEMIGAWLWKFEYLPTLQAIVDKSFPFPVPSLEEYEKNFSIIVANTVFGYDSPRPITPNVIPVGGMHLKPAAPLNQDLQEFLNAAEHGAIFFSLGSNMQSSMLPPDVQQSFIEAFSELPQRVLWKFESDNLKNKPDNVMLGKWLPQRDILAHKNIKLFITHNGLTSSLEAVYFGVPTLGIPFFMDQHKNMKRARRLGTGLGIQQHKLNKDTILTSIKQILANSSFTENVQRLSAVFRDQIDNPLERAIFWTEYVIRHNGATHLRTSAVDMPLYSYLLLDILVAIVVLLLAILLVLKATLQFFIRKLLGTNKKSKTD